MGVDLRFENGRGQTLAGTLHHPIGAPCGGAVICHGMLSHRRSPKHLGLARKLSSLGVLTLRFDFAGRGESEGRTEDITYEGQVQDLAAAVSVVRGEADPLALVGSSMGGAVAILYASNDPAISCVVGIATVGRPSVVLVRHGAPAMAQRWRDAGTIEIAGHRLGYELLRSARRADVVGAARSLTCPLLLVHGARDDVVPLAQAQELAGAARRARLEVLATGDHVLHGQADQEALVRLVGQFVTRHVTRSIE